jgi:1-phosphatidylinositol-3-phosphate 5-kinase
MKSRDDWLVIKKLSQVELDALVIFSPEYFEYMSQALFNNLPTILAKIFGFYHISYKNATTKKTTKMDIMVIENLFFERRDLKIFDLKGSIRNRHVQSTGKQNQVLLDKNLLEFIYESPLLIREHSKKILKASIYNDTLFLSKLNVMDYSLLVGLDEASNELVIGIVDLLRTFTWDKKLESWVKETGLLGGGSEPTIVTPRQYKNRFREAMDRYFVMVPDKFVKKE